MADQLYMALLFFTIFCGSSGRVDAQSTRIRVHDPVMIKAGDTFHLFCTGRGIAHFTSTDMINWDSAAPVFPEKPTWTDQIVPNFRNHIWAPDIVRHNDRYYIYYSISAFGKNTSAIGVATTPTLDPEDPKQQWTDHGIVIRSIPNRDLWNAIDPNIAFDEHGTPWMSFGSFWNGLKLVKLAPDLLSIAEPQEWYTVARRERSPEVSDKNAGSAALEAPFIFRKDEYFYLFLSWDYCCRGEASTYKVVVGRSRNIEGPYFDKNDQSLFHGGGSPVLSGNERWHGAGHCSVYTVKDKDYIFFHGYDAQDEGRSKLIIEEVRWDADGWPRVSRRF